MTATATETTWTNWRRRPIGKTRGGTLVQHKKREQDLAQGMQPSVDVLDSIAQLPIHNRLKWVTQVPGLGAVRSRHVHSLQVGEIASRISERCWPEYDSLIVKAYGQLHDVGHPPLMHVARPILQSFLDTDNLGDDTWASEYLLAASGITDHRLLASSAGHSDAHDGVIPFAGACVELADRLEYTVHDRQAAIHIGRPGADLLPEGLPTDFPTRFDDQIRYLEDDVVATWHDTGRLAFGPNAIQALTALRDHNIEYIYKPDDVVIFESRAQEMLRSSLLDMKGRFQQSEGFDETHAKWAAALTVLTFTEPDLLRYAHTHLEIDETVIDDTLAPFMQTGPDWQTAPGWNDIHSADVPDFPTSMPRVLKMGKHLEGLSI